MFDLTRFSLGDMTRLGVMLRRAGAGAVSMEDAAANVVGILHSELGTGSGDERACVLVRTFLTLPVSELDAEQQAFAAHVLGGAVPPAGLKCLTLLATRGELPEWNSRHTSSAHKALPLASEASVARSPMISQLIQQLGVELTSLLAPDSDVMLDSAQHTFNVFHVAEARGSVHIPAQADFVEPHGVRSVLGFGGLLVPGELFATILFSRVPITREVAILFRTLALNVKLALLPYRGVRTFS